MKGIISSKSAGLIVKYIIKAILLSALCTAILCACFSALLLKLDLPLTYSKNISVIIMALTSFTVGFISVGDFKNNGALLGILAQLPLIIFSLFNTLFNESSFIFFLIKLTVCLFLGMISGYLRVEKSGKIRI